MKLMWNFAVLALLVVAALVVLNLMTRYFGFPEFIRMEFVEEFLKRMGR